MSGFALNPALDVAELGEAYAQKKRLHIPDILVAESAETIASCLATQVPWGFAYSDGEPKYHRAEALARMPAEEQQAILKLVSERAKAGFQYAYNTYPILDAYLQKWGQVPLLDHLLDFINSPEVLNFARKLTGRDDIIKGDAQATRYGPNQFLKLHDDDVANEYRVAAFVFNFTRDWDPDWGGYLQFFDENRDITDAFLPRFNALNVFTVPQDHAVSCVAHYANAQRYAVTGWFRYK